MVFDKATGIGRRVGTKVAETKLFGAFKLHYRSESRYCNPYSGHEKGNVENAVGFLRRNLMVPNRRPPPWPGLTTFCCVGAMRLAATTHYRKGLPSGELFRQDRAASLALPGVGFDGSSRIGESLGERRPADNVSAQVNDSCITFRYVLFPAFENILGHPMMKFGLKAVARKPVCMLADL
jgi:hypothetical protein